jgi:hypothetical protein
MAKGKGVSLNMTKQDVIDLLDKVEPGVDHSTLSGPSLAAAKEKHGIGVLKNKQQLIDALNKHGGQQAPEQTKRDLAEKGASGKALTGSGRRHVVDSEGKAARPGVVEKLPGRCFP